MSRLLVSVRSAEEARAALAGGAAVIDVKEPGRGPLGRADRFVWAEVIEVVAGRAPVSAALGELAEGIPPDACGIDGLAFRKIGLAHAPADWRERWGRLMDESGPIPWVAAIYADAALAGAPVAEAVLDFALSRSEIAGVLIDTYDKVQATSLDLGFAPLLDRVRSSGRFVALAGGLDVAGIRRLSPLRPDLFAVRGAACEGGSRLGRVSTARVAELVAVTTDV